MDVIDIDSEVVKSEVKYININDGDENKNTINPWVVKHHLPIWWKCLVIILGKSHNTKIYLCKSSCCNFQVHYY